MDDSEMNSMMSQVRPPPDDEYNRRMQAAGTTQQQHPVRNSPPATGARNYPSDIYQPTPSTSNRNTGNVSRPHEAGASHTPSQGLHTGYNLSQNRGEILSHPVSGGAHLNTQPRRHINNWTTPSTESTPSGQLPEPELPNQMIFDEELLKRDVNARQRTFFNWKKTNIISPKELAEAGLYFTGPGDVVQCVFCKVRINNWVRGDNAMNEHRKFQPDCPFLQQQSGGSSIMHIIDPLDDEMGGRGLDIGPDEEMNVNVITDRPVHQNMAIESVRLNTFTNWPLNLRQRPTELAKAGFFYCGEHDNCRCFFCDGGLRNWEPNDDPWVEHVRWFPQCGFVRQSKGPEFIRHVIDQFGQGDQLLFQKVESLMDSSDQVRYVANMGYCRDIIRRVLEKQIRMKGENFPNVQSFLEALLADSFSAENQPPSQTATSQAMPRGAGQPTVQGNQPRSVDVHSGGASGLSEEQKLKQELEELRDRKKCKVCWEEDVSVLFLPCAHLVVCTECAPALRNCPVCRAAIRGTVRTYMP